MAKEKEKPLTREDVLRLIEENGGTAKGLDLSGKAFEAGIDLHGLDLEGIILKKARFAVRFIRTDISADIGAQLQGAKLMGANLQEASLRFASLQGADLSNSNLQEANLSGAHLEGTRLNSAELSPGTQLGNVDWGSMVGEEASKEFGSAERIYRSLEKWHEEHGIRDLASEFAYKKQRARKNAIGAEMRQNFKEALEWRG